jgi:hypothetical protein
MNRLNFRENGQYEEVLTRGMLEVGDMSIQGIDKSNALDITQLQGNQLNQDTLVEKMKQSRKELKTYSSDESFYSYKSGFDIEYANYIRETVPKTTWSNDYLQELWEEKSKYLKTVRQNENGYGFDDICEGAAYAYSSIYQQIVEGYKNGTREIYVCDDKESGNRRLLTMDEDLEKLNKGFEELIKWDQMVAKSQKQNAENRQKFQNEKTDDLFYTYDENQACDYIQDTYSEIRSRYQEEYEKNDGNVDIKAMVYSIIQSKNQSMHDYCKLLFEKIGYVA